MITGSIPDLRVVIREAVNDNLTVDVPNLNVRVVQGDGYNVSIASPDVTVERSGSFTTYADLAGQVVTASYALVAGVLLGAIETSSYSLTAVSASYALTASYVSGAASSWDTLTGIPSGLVSSSAQATTWTVASASVATTAISSTSASYATTASNAVTASHAISSSYASNADLFDGLNSTVFATTGSNTFVGAQTISGSLQISGSISTVDYIDFNIASDEAIAHTEGRVHWDTDAKTLELDTDVNNFMIEVGHQNVLRGRNTYAFTLTKGTVVYINGESGNRPIFAAASWDTEFDSASTIGIIAQDINSSQNGYAVTNGLLRDIDTTAYVPGTKLYLSASGQYTNQIPISPLHEVRLGTTITQAVSGIIYVDVMNGYEIGELHDVIDSTTTASYGDILVKSGNVWITARQLTGSYGLSGSLHGTASLATSASYAPTILPAGIVSSSAQINTGSFTGSFTGEFTGTSSWAQNAVTASAATSITFVPTSASYAVTASYAANVSAADFNTLLNKPTLVSSSAQVNTGSFTGSFVGVFTGTSSWASNAISSSFATSAGSSTSASYALTASYATTALTASYFSGSMDFPNGLSVTGSVLATAGFTGSLQGTSSWASNTVSASYALTSSYAINAGAGAGFPFSGSAVITGSLVVSSSGINVIGSGITGSLLGTASWAQNAVTASYFSGSVLFENGLIITGSLNVSGSITGSLMGTASWATNAISSSYAVTSSLALNNIVTASAAASIITFTKGDGSQFSVTVAQSGSVESSSYATSAGSAISASYAVTASAATSITFTPATASYAITASYAENAGGAVGFPFSGSAVITGSLLVSGSGNISASSANIPSITGSLLGTSSWASTAISSSYAVTASHAQTAVTSSYFSGSVRFPDGLSVTGSLNVSGSITGSLLGTASWANNAISSSYAVTASYAPTILPDGVVSSSAQINTGSFTGSFVGEFIGTSSWANNALAAVTASYAESAGGYINFPNGLTVTGSTLSTGGFTGSLQGTASQATRLTAIAFTTPSIVVSPSFVAVTSGSQHLTNGTYVVSCTINNSELTNYRLSGVVSWTTASANVTVDDEVFLHRSGYTTASVFLRTFAVSASLPELQLGSDMTLSTAQYAFTFIPTA